MARIYKLTDKIEYDFGDIRVKISPLSVNDKSILTDLMVKGQSKQDVNSLMEGSLYALRCSIKDVQGLEDSEGNPYKLEFDDSGKLTKECAEELLNIEQSTKLISLCSSFINGIPTNLPDGVSVINPKKAQ